jgi:hypothetical protein
MQRVRAGMGRRRRVEMPLAEYQRCQQGDAGGNSYGFHKPDYIQGAGAGLHNFAVSIECPKSFMYIVYSLLLWVAALLSLPWWLVQMLRLGKYRSGLPERLGFVPARLKSVKPGCVWVHAVSVGEVLAVSQLIAELQKNYPERQILVSTTTATGQSLRASALARTACFSCLSTLALPFAAT